MSNPKRSTTKRRTAAPKTRADNTGHKLRTPKHGGGKLRTGNPGNKGGPGRPPKEFKEMCRRLVGSEAMEGTFTRVLKKPTHPAWTPTVKLLTEHGYGAPDRTVKVSGGAAPIGVYDLSKATDEDLQRFEELAARMAVVAAEPEEGPD
jgi:hypothetical protein